MSENLIKEDSRPYENKSIFFFLPMLGNFYHEFKNLRGVFIGAEELPELQNHIFLLFVNSNSPEFKENLSRLKSYANFYKSYKPDKFHTMLIFTPTTELKNDYDLLKQSKYSKISQKYKEHIFKFYNLRNGTSSSNPKLYNDIYSVLYKTENLRNFLMEKLGTHIPEENELASALRMEKSELFPEYPVEVYLDEMKILTNIDNQKLLI